MNRAGESGVVPSRHNRFFQQHEYWYYRTREGIDIGPFDSLSDAQRGANEFIDYVVNHNPKFADVLSRYKAAA